MVIETAFRADSAERGIAVSDAHAEAKVVPVFAPGLRQLLHAPALRTARTDGSGQGSGSGSWSCSGHFDCF